MSVTTSPMIDMVDRQKHAACRSTLLIVVALVPNGYRHARQGRLAAAEVWLGGDVVLLLRRRRLIVAVHHHEPRLLRHRARLLDRNPPFSVERVPPRPAVAAPPDPDVLKEDVLARV